MYVVYEDVPGIKHEQQAERVGALFWPTVRTGTLGQIERPSRPAMRPMTRGKQLRGFGTLRRNTAPCPTCRMPFGDIEIERHAAGSLGVGSVVVLGAGSTVIGPTGDRLQLNTAVRFRMTKAVEVEVVGESLESWAPAHASVAFTKDAAVEAIDPVDATPIDAGGMFSAQPGFKATIQAGMLFAVESAGAGSTGTVAAVPAVFSDRRALHRVGMIIAIASAITVVGLFAATLSLGEKS